MPATQPIDWKPIEAAVKKWIDGTLTHLRKRRVNLKALDARFVRDARFCLLSGREYIEAAFDSYRAGRFHAGLCCCRTAYEIAIRLQWCAMRKCQFESRIDRWWKDTVRQSKNLLEALSQDRPGPWDQELQDTKRELERLHGVERLPKDICMAKEIVEAAGREHNPLYTIYRILSASTHASLDYLRFWPQGPTTVVVSSKAPMPSYAPRVTVTCAQALVYAPRKWVDWNLDQLEEESQQLYASLSS